MNASSPPRLAQWLLERCVSGPRRESLIGDMVEQYRRGRSAAWFWRQTIRIVGANLFPAVSIVALGLYLPRIYMFLHVRWIARLDSLWYPRLIDSRWSWMAINPWAYRLQLYALTSRIAWCVLIAAVAWATTRWRPRQRRLIMTLLPVTLVGQNLPYLWISLMYWLREPGNPIWFFGFFWFAFSTLVLLPASLLLAARGASAARGEPLDPEQDDALNSVPRASRARRPPAA
jgi:hypothetical protein